VNHSTNMNAVEGQPSLESRTPQNPWDPQRNAKPGANGVRRGQRILLGICALAVIAACVFGYWYLFMRGIVYSDDARLSGHLVDLAPEINGRLIEVAVHEGQFMHKGAIVFRLDPAIPHAALNQAEASLISAKANLASNEALYQKALNGNRPEEIKAAEATVKRLQNEEELARLDFERNQVLFKRNTVSQDNLDRARTAYESAQQSRENAVQNLILLQQGSRKEDIAAAKAAVELARSRVTEAEAAVESARGNLARCIVKAPFDGWGVRRWLDPGAMPLASQPVVSMFDPSTLRVDANIEEKYLHDVAIGDKVDISVDAYPALHLRGRLTQILRATNSEFSLIPAEGVSGTFIKVTQRVPLRISVTAPADLPLGPGLSVEVRIHSGTSTSPASGQEVAHD
jgi:membrane fusion protein (multidrug efflux system)